MPSLKQALTNRHVIWLHAVSVGEVNLCTQLIRALEPRVPNIKIVVSTTTTTGMAELRRRLPTHVSKIYYPVDRRKFVNRALATINPKAIVLVEAEIWPNFLWRAQRLGIPVFLANARLSDRSFPRYKKFAFLFRPLFASFTGVGCAKRSGRRAPARSRLPARSRPRGGQPEIRRGEAGRTAVRSMCPAMLRQLGVPADAPILVAGSTHDGEEMILAEMAERLRAQISQAVSRAGADGISSAAGRSAKNCAHAA